MGLGAANTGASALPLVCKVEAVRASILIEVGLSWASHQVVAMKKKLLTILRLVVAGLGMAFILWSLTWSDYLLLPAGYLNAQQTEPIRAKVSERPDTAEDGQWHVKLPQAYGSKTLTIQPAKVGTDEGVVRYQPGVLRTLRQARWHLLLVGLLLVAVLPVGQSLRWWLLMRCRGLDPGYAKALRLSLVSMFFNFSLPGMTGGDLVKAYYAAKGSGDAQQP